MTSGHVALQKWIYSCVSLPHTEAVKHRDKTLECVIAHGDHTESCVLLGPNYFTAHFFKMSTSLSYILMSWQSVYLVNK